MAPAFVLMVTAPAVAELLAGATRLSSAFVFPLEMLIWGSGAVFVRELVRRYRLGWFNLVLLALSLAMAEELLIQQTSFAPLVIQLQHQEYARVPLLGSGFNYLYFLWALLYEAILVVCVPIALVELLFPQRRDAPWLNVLGLIPMIALFPPASFAAWYGWNVVAREKVFHLPPYRLSASLAWASILLIGATILLAVGPLRRRLAAPSRPRTPPPPALLFALAVAAMAVLFGLEVLAFGIKPDLPPIVPMLIGLAQGGTILVLIPSWQASPAWTVRHTIAAAYGAAWGMWGLMFYGFGSGFDLYGKIALDALGVILMLMLAAFALRREAQMRPVHDGNAGTAITA